MASGGIYDHLGGGFARYSVDERVAGAALREDALRPGAARPRLPPRWQVLGEPRWTPGGRGDDRLRARASCATPTAASTRPRTPTRPTSTATATRACSTRGRPTQFADVLGDDARRGDRVVRARRTTATSRAASIPSRLHHRGDLERPPEIEAARAAAVRRPRRRAPARARRQGAHRVERADAGVAGRGRRGDRPRRLARRRASPTASSCSRELRGADGRWLRSWQADGEPPARHAALAADHAALVDAFTRLAEATGEARWIDAARAAADTLLDHFWDVENGGLFTTADDGEALDRAPEGPAGQRHAGGQHQRRAGAVPPRRAHRRAPLHRATPTRSCACSAG